MADFKSALPGLQMVDLKKQYENIKDEIDEAIRGVVDSAAFIQGPPVKKFEEQLARYNKVNHVIGCANGTDALQIILMALDFKPGDEIIIPCFTYVATAEVIALLGLNPVMVDVDPDTFNIDPSKFKKAITSKTKAVVPVHLYGQNANMDMVMSIAATNEIHVIEDAAQSIGAEYTSSSGDKYYSGCMGIAGSTSFFPSKNLGCFGDGGAIFTNDNQLAKKMRMIANHGQDIKYHHDKVGVNSRLDTLQAAILSVKLKYLDKYRKARQEAAACYDKKLAPIPEITVPLRDPKSTHVFHQYTIRINGGERDELRKYLQGFGVPTMVYYPLPLHLQKAYFSEGIKEGSFPVAEELSKKVLSLPIHTEMDTEQLDFITDKLISFYR
jgi:UDP-2-acetamido-2-deoxy-ribo-hexuluronate aminotransferase